MADRIIKEKGETWEREDRPDMIYPHLQRIDGGRVFSQGCGNGYVENTLAKRDTRFVYHAYDLDSFLLGCARKSAGEQQNVHFHEGNNYSIQLEGNDWAVLMRLRAPGTLLRYLDHLRSGGLIFYEGVGEFTNEDAPPWNYLMPYDDVDIPRRPRIEENVAKLRRAGMQLIEERRFNKIEFITPDWIEEYLGHFLGFRGLVDSETLTQEVPKIIERWRSFSGTKDPNLCPIGYHHAWYVFQKP